MINHVANARHAHFCAWMTSGPGCSKHRKLNELVKRSTRLVFYDFITKYTDIFCCFSHFFNKKYWIISDIKV